MTAATNLVVVPDIKPGQRVGLMTWWRTSGDTPYDVLKEEWLKNDLDEAELPSLPGDSAALNRALRTLYQEQRCLVRVLPNSRYAIVDEDVKSDDEEDPEYDVRFKCWIDFEELELKFDREVDSTVADKVFDAFNEARLALTPADMSGWFVRRAMRLNCVALRDTGGIYFIPETTAETWSKFADIIAKVSRTRIFEVPALRTDRAVEAIMDAVIQETQQEVEALEKLLDDREFSERGLRGKAKQCDTLADKLKKYEHLLGVRMTEMQETIQAVDARIADMMLAVEDD